MAPHIYLPTFYDGFKMHKKEQFLRTIETKCVCDPRKYCGLQQGFKFFKILIIIHVIDYIFYIHVYKIHLNKDLNFFKVLAC